MIHPASNAMAPHHQIAKFAQIQLSFYIWVHAMINVLQLQDFTFPSHLFSKQLPTLKMSVFLLVPTNIMVIQTLMSVFLVIMSAKLAAIT